MTDENPTNNVLSLLNPADQAWLAKTFKDRNAEFGGWLMEEGEGGEGEPPAGEGEGQEPDPSGNNEQDPADPQAGETDPEGAGEGEGGNEDDESEMSPEDLRQALAKARKDAAKYRTQHRTFREQMADAKTPEEVQALVDAAVQTEAAETRALLVENVALKHSLPADLAARLVGNTREELEADAKNLAKFAVRQVTDADDLSGGLDPAGGDAAFDPTAEAKKLRRGRRHH